LSALKYRQSVVKVPSAAGKHGPLRLVVVCLLTFNTDQQARMARPALACGVAGCSYVAARSCYMTAHVRQHAGGTVYPCPEPSCSAIYVCPTGLVAHRIVHTGLRPFACSLPGCSYTTTTRRLIAMHTKRHNGTYAHVCHVEGCGYVSVSRCALISHSRSLHGMMPPRKEQTYRKPSLRVLGLAPEGT
jgi:hypothetical protein